MTTILDEKIAWKKGDFILRFAKIEDLEEVYRADRYLMALEKSSPEIKENLKTLFRQKDYRGYQKRIKQREFIIIERNNKIVGTCIFLKFREALDLTEIGEEHRAKKIYMFPALISVALSLLLPHTRIIKSLVISVEERSRVLDTYEKVVKDLDLKMEVAPEDIARTSQIKVWSEDKSPNEIFLPKFNAKVEKLLNKLGWEKIKL